MNQNDDELLIDGNVDNLCVRAAGLIGPPESGQLIFHARFESGNLGRVDYIHDFEYDLYIRSDTCNPKHRVWFYFSVRNCQKDQRVVFNITNSSKNKSLHRDGMAPVVCSKKRPKWHRIPRRHVHHHTSSIHESKFVMSFAFAFDDDTDVFYFAYCYPYTYSRLQKFLADCDSRDLPYYGRTLLTTSVQQRRIDCLTITNPTNLDKDHPQEMVFITARIHPGESPASFVCEENIIAESKKYRKTIPKTEKSKDNKPKGLISFLLGETKVAEELRNTYVFKIVPMLNPDGVYLGNYRCSLMGFDLNRHWNSPSVWAHPPIYAVKEAVLVYSRPENVKIRYFVDIHTHTAQLNSFLYGNLPQNQHAGDNKRNILLPSMLHRIAPDFSLTQTQFNADPTKAGTGRRAMADCLPSDCSCYTLEVSVFGYEDTSQKPNTVPYTEALYQKLGENLARALNMVSKSSDLDSIVGTTTLTPKPQQQRTRPKTMTLDLRKREECEIVIQKVQTVQRQLSNVSGKTAE